MIELNQHVRKEIHDSNSKEKLKLEDQYKDIQHQQEEQMRQQAALERLQMEEKLRV